jgi:hypothetical protein
MELRIENFTENGNHLKWRSAWRDYQQKRCRTKSHARIANKMHYGRILDSLTDNRSIDVLVDKSLKSVKKMDMDEVIFNFIEESKGKFPPDQLAEKIAIALEVPLDDTVAYRKIFDLVMEQIKSGPPPLAEVSIAVDGRPVEIKATEEGVVASKNPFSLTGVSSVHIDEETGEHGVTVWSGDNQAPSRMVDIGGFKTKQFGGSGERETFNPMQFSVPTSLPPPMKTVAFNREAIPTSNELIVSRGGMSDIQMRVKGALQEYRTKTVGEHPLYEKTQKYFSPAKDAPVDTSKIHGILEKEKLLKGKSYSSLLKMYAMNDTAFNEDVGLYVDRGEISIEGGRELQKLGRERLQPGIQKAEQTVNFYQQLHREQAAQTPSGVTIHHPHYQPSTVKG